MLCLIYTLFLMHCFSSIQVFYSMMTVVESQGEEESRGEKERRQVKVMRLGEDREGGLEVKDLNMLLLTPMCT